MPARPHGVSRAAGMRWMCWGARLDGGRNLALGSRLSALGSRLSALGSRLSALGSRLSALGSRLSALGSRLSALGSRLSALGSRLSALGSRLSALGSRLSALGSRLSALGSELYMRQKPAARDARPEPTRETVVMLRASIEPGGHCRRPDPNRTETRQTCRILTWNRTDFKSAMHRLCRNIPQDRFPGCSCCAHSRSPAIRSCHLAIPVAVADGLFGFDWTRSTFSGAGNGDTMPRLGYGACADVHR